MNQSRGGNQYIIIAAALSRFIKLGKYFRSLFGNIGIGI